MEIIGFQKGHVEKGESIEATIKRECYEEVEVLTLRFLGYPMYNHYIVKTSIEKVIYMLSKTYHDTLNFKKTNYMMQCF